MHSHEQVILMSGSEQRSNLSASPVQYSQIGGLWLLPAVRARTFAPDLQFRLDLDADRRLARRPNQLHDAHANERSTRVCQAQAWIHRRIRQCGLGTARLFPPQSRSELLPHDRGVGLGLSGAHLQ
jgi:hypothetical protein